MGNQSLKMSFSDEYVKTWQKLGFPQIPEWENILRKAILSDKPIPVYLYLDKKKKIRLSFKPKSDEYVLLRSDITYSEYQWYSSEMELFNEVETELEKVAQFLDFGYDLLGNTLLNISVDLLPTDVGQILSSFVLYFYWLVDNPIYSDFMDALERVAYDFFEGRYESYQRSIKLRSEFENLPDEDKTFVVEKVRELAFFEPFISLMNMCISPNGGHFSVLPYEGGLAKQPYKLIRAIMVVKKAYGEHLENEQRKKNKSSF